MTTNAPKRYLNECNGTYVPPKLAAPPPPPPKKDYTECKGCLERVELEQIEEIKKRLSAGVYKDHAEYSISVTSRVINIIDTESDIRLLLKIIEG